MNQDLSRRFLLSKSFCPIILVKLVFFKASKTFFIITCTLYINDMMAIFDTFALMYHLFLRYKT